MNLTIKKFEDSLQSFILLEEQNGYSCNVNNFLRKNVGNFFEVEVNISIKSKFILSQPSNLSTTQTSDLGLSNEIDKNMTLSDALLNFFKGDSLVQTHVCRYSELKDYFKPTKRNICKYSIH